MECLHLHASCELGLAQLLRPCARLFAHSRQRQVFAEPGWLCDSSGRHLHVLGHDDDLHDLANAIGARATLALLPASSSKGPQTQQEDVTDSASWPCLCARFGEWTVKEREKERE